MARAQAVQWLWAIVQELDGEEARRFLKFFTGSDRAPIGGLGNLRCVIQRDGADSPKLPTSHTCFNTLLLPAYRSRRVMAQRLLDRRRASGIPEAGSDVLLAYADCGHLIRIGLWPTTVQHTSGIGLGGTAAGLAAAQADVTPRVLEAVTG